MLVRWRAQAPGLLMLGPVLGLMLGLAQTATAAQIDADAAAPKAERVLPIGTPGRSIDRALDGGLSTGDRSLDLLLEVQRGSQYRPEGLQTDPARDGLAQTGKTLARPAARSVIGPAELPSGMAGAAAMPGVAAPPGTSLPSALPTTGITAGAGRAGGGEIKRDWVGINNGAFGSGVLGNGGVGNGGAGNGGAGNGGVSNGAIGNGAIGIGAIGNAVMGNAAMGNPAQGNGSTGSPARNYGAAGAYGDGRPALPDSGRDARGQLFQPRDLLLFVKNNLLEIVLGCGLVLLVIAGAKAYSRRP